MYTKTTLSHLPCTVVHGHLLLQCPDHKLLAPRVRDRLCVPSCLIRNSLVVHCVLLHIVRAHLSQHIPSIGASLSEICY